LKLTFLGTLCELSFPRKGCDCPQCKEAKKLGGDYFHRFHSSLLIEKGKKKIVINVGANLKNRVKKVNPNHVLLTHAHPDHAGGLASLDPACDVFLTQEAARGAKKHFTTGRKLTIIKPNIPFWIEGIQFIAHRVYHSTIAPAVCFKIADRILYAPDCLKFYDEEVLNGVECYICDGSSLVRDIARPGGVGHMSIKNHIQLAKKYGVNYIIPTHIGHIRLSEKLLLKQVEMMAERAGLKQARVAVDGMKLGELGENMHIDTHKGQKLEEFEVKGYDPKKIGDERVLRDDWRDSGT